MIPLPWKRARTSTPSSSLTTGIAAVLAAGLAASFAVVLVASPASAGTGSYTSGSFTVGDGGPSTPSPVTVTVPAGLGSLKSLSLTLNNPQHLHPQDMRFDLRSPSGTTVRIGCNDGRTVFGDNQTCTPLTPFYGADPAGTWELFPYDTLALGDDPNTRYGGFTLTLETGSAPAITTSPEDVTTPSGTTVTLTSAGTGDPAPAVQWQVDSGDGFADLPGASTSADYTLTPVSADSGNRYQAVYSNASGSVTTQAATLTVLALAPSITVDPSDTTVGSGATATFSSDTTGDPAPTVQWERAAPGTSAFVPVLGATAKSLTLSTVTFADNGAQFRAVYTNAGGQAVTDAATLTVAALVPSVTQDPSDATVASGDDASFVAAGDSEVPQTVQWQRGAHDEPFTDIEGETSTTLTFAASFAQNGDTFRAVFTNPAGSTTTSAATLTVTPESAQVATDPTDVTVVAGEPASFSASATGDPTPTIQWRLSTDGGTTFTDIDGATGATYTFTTTAADDGNQYLAVFDNAGGTDTTSAATLTVTVVPVATQSPAAQTVTVNTQATFTSAATGQPAPSVRWQVSTDAGATYSDITGATGASLSVLAEASANGNLYRAIYTNAGGIGVTSAASLSVLVPAPAVASPAPLAVTAADPAPLVVTAADPAPLAATGADSWILAMAAALMVAAGAAVVVTRRRMRTTS